MMDAAVSRRAEQLAAQGVAFVTATVVRAQRPTSVEPGNVALVLGDGTIEGFVGGVCAEQSVRVYSLRAIETGEATLLRILPDAAPVPDAAADAAADADGEAAPEGHEVASEEGAVTVQNPCLSGGAMEIFLEPALPAPRVLVVGDTPIAGALRRLGAELGLELVAVDRGVPDPSPGDLAIVVAAHGRDELHSLRRGLETGVPYIGLVASRKRGAGVLAELRDDGVSAELLELIDVPAGIEIGARTPAEIALSILAKIVAVRRAERDAVPAPASAPVRTGTPEHASAGTPEHASAPARAGSPSSATAPTIAIDPVCGMTVAAVAGTPSVQHDGETVYFCCEGCRATFEAQHGHAIAAG
jgi:xanthine dehydrogenase accessory factor